MGQFLNTNTQATNYSVQASEARTQGMLQRRQAYANAYKLEADSREKGILVGENMMRAESNALARIAALRGQVGASGFAEAGSKLREEQSTAEALKMAISDMGKSYAISDQNARNQANQYRREGDTALRLANIQGDLYDRLARINRKAAPWLGAGELLMDLSKTVGSLNWGGSQGSKVGMTGGAGASGVENQWQQDAAGNWKITGRSRH